MKKSEEKKSFWIEDGCEGALQFAMDAKEAALSMVRC